MKARIPPKIPKQLKQEAERIAKSAYEQIREKENKNITRRVFKTMLYALHKDFGFGRDRCAKALKSMTEIIEHSDSDEVFWEPSPSYGSDQGLIRGYEDLHTFRILHFLSNQTCQWHQ